jgi:hypothetical protein
MPLPTLDEIEALVSGGRLIRLPSAAASTRALDARDTNDEFERAWLEADADVGPSTPEHATAILRVAKAAFDVAVAQLPGHEIASYVSDDLELLARAASKEAGSPFLERLWHQYVQNGFAIAG